MDEPYLSIVAPCYNEEAVLLEFYQRVTAVCTEMDLSYELVLVNDGSGDGTWDIMRSLNRRDPNVVSVNMTRNHGHQLALSAGLSLCRGQRILVIDADLQDPPELLPAMMERMDDGVDVVYGKRRRRKGESFFKRVTASLFYRLIRKLSSVRIPSDTGDFRLMSRRVLNALLDMPERHRFIRGMVSWIGYRQEPFVYDRDPRFAGETKYPLRQMMRLALDAITSFSTKPLHFASMVGMATVVLALGMLGIGVTCWIEGVTEPTLLVLGWLTLLGGVQLLGQGILGEYVGRLSEQSKGRPMFLIERVERFDPRQEFKPLDQEDSSPNIAA